MDFDEATTELPKGVLTVSVADKQGNVTRIEHFPSEEVN